MKEKIKVFLQTLKGWSWVDWVMNLRYFGYLLLIIKGWDDKTITIPELLIFGAVIGLMERKAKEIRK